MKNARQFIIFDATTLFLIVLVLATGELTESKTNMGRREKKNCGACSEKTANTFTAHCFSFGLR